MSPFGRLCACLLIALTIQACTSRPDILAEIHERKLLYIGIDPSYPPFGALAADGTLFGIDVDLGHELAQRMGVEANFVLLGYDGLYHALDLGQVDLLISALVIDQSRSQDVSYSTSYFDDGLRLIVTSEGRETIGEMEDMAGRRLAVEYAAQADGEARRWARRLPDLDLMHLATANDAMSAVLSGAADAALVDGVSAELRHVHDHSDLVAVSPPVTAEPLAIAVRSEDRTLIRAVDDALKGIKADGTLEAILSRWLD